MATIIRSGFTLRKKKHKTDNTTPNIASIETNLLDHENLDATMGTKDVHGATSINTVDQIIKRDASGDFACNEMTGTATAALYSDLAERYTLTGIWEPGMLASRNKEEGSELKISDKELDPDVFGIITTKPAHLMNRGCDGPGITMIGRVPVLVKGSVKKWDKLVPAGEGFARKIKKTDDQKLVIGEALESNSKRDIKKVECFSNVLRL